MLTRSAVNEIETNENGKETKKCESLLHYEQKDRRTEKWNKDLSESFHQKQKERRTEKSDLKKFFHRKQKETEDKISIELKVSVIEDGESNDKTEYLQVLNARSFVKMQTKIQRENYLLRENVEISSKKESYRTTGKCFVLISLIIN
jgi:hypothetical protein